jgi:RNA polymerase sigma factor (sigma-70 family)
VLVIDADLGLANVEIVFGLKPRYHTGDLINSSISIEDVMIEAPHGVKILPAGSGVQSKLSTKLGREATVEEVAEEMDADLDEVSGVHALLEPHVPLDSVMAQLVSEDSAEDPMLRKQILERLTKAIEKIPERLQLILQLHHVEGLTYKEILGILDVSEPRVCQLHADAITKEHAPPQRGGAGAAAPGEAGAAVLRVV